MNYQPRPEMPSQDFGGLPLLGGPTSGIPGVPAGIEAMVNIKLNFAIYQLNGGGYLLVVDNRDAIACSTLPEVVQAIAETSTGVCGDASQLRVVQEGVGQAPAQPVVRRTVPMPRMPVEMVPEAMPSVLDKMKESAARSAGAVGMAVMLGLGKVSQKLT